jgi:hypothetical protein
MSGGAWAWFDDSQHGYVYPPLLLTCGQRMLLLLQVWHTRAAEAVAAAAAAWPNPLLLCHDREVGGQ